MESSACMTIPGLMILSVRFSQFLPQACSKAAVEACISYGKTHRKVVVGQHAGPSEAQVSLVLVLVVMHMNHHLLQFTRLEQDFKRGKAQVAVVLGSLVAPLL
jgi:hypothetical protein